MQTHDIEFESEEISGGNLNYSTNYIVAKAAALGNFKINYCGHVGYSGFLMLGWVPAKNELLVLAGPVDCSDILIWRATQTDSEVDIPMSEKRELESLKKAYDHEARMSIGCINKLLIFTETERNIDIRIDKLPDDKSKKAYLLNRIKKQKSIQNKISKILQHLLDQLAKEQPDQHKN